MTEPRIMLMPDWAAFPVWGLAPHHVLSAELRADLITWGQRWEVLADEGEHVHGLGDDDDWLAWPPWADFVARGRQLRARLAEELHVAESEIGYETFS